MKHGYPPLRMNVEKYVSGLHFDLQEVYKLNERAMLFYAEDTLSDNFQVAAAIQRVFNEYTVRAMDADIPLDLTK